jgi:hypothetical protein
MDEKRNAGRSDKKRNQANRLPRDNKVSIRDHFGRLALFGIAVVGIVALLSYVFLKPGVLRLRQEPPPPAKAVSREFFIDVWKLRHDVAELEPLQASENADQCYPEGNDEEGDPDAPPPSPAEIERQKEIARQQAEAGRACVADSEKKYAAYKAAVDAFNGTWQLLLARAIQSGDPVAEVIMRQCSTTPVLDRSKIESTCDADPKRRAVAAKRLREIGFAPGFDSEFEMREHSLRPEDESKEMTRLGLTLPQLREKAIRDQQQLMLEQFRQGAFGTFGSNTDVRMGNAGDADNIERYKLIKAAIQSTRRAFTYASAPYGRGLGAFATLQLNRKPQTPGDLTWGPDLFDPSSNAPTPTEDFLQWRYSGLGNPIIVSRVPPGDYTFLDHLRKLLADSEGQIDRYLAEEPRWSVFLLHRTGHHEWVPEGMQSATHRLTPNWLGQWQLERTFQDWGLSGNFVVDGSRPGAQELQGTIARSATVARDGELTRINFQTHSDFGAPLEDVSGCELRYSGGLTYLPQIENAAGAASAGQDWTHTALGDLGKDCWNKFNRSGAGSDRAVGGHCRSAKDNGPAFAPLDPTKRYEQVLVQCLEGESVESDQIRFLLLEGDTLVEFAASAPQNQILYVRHYRRVEPNKASTVGVGAAPESGEVATSDTRK